MDFVLWLLASVNKVWYFVTLVSLLTARYDMTNRDSLVQWNNTCRCSIIFRFLFRPGSTMALSNVFNRVKMLPGGLLGFGASFLERTERNQRFGGPLKIPRLIIPPPAARFQPVVLWEVSWQCRSYLRGETFTLLPNGSPFGDPGSHGDLFQSLGPH